MQVKIKRMEKWRSIVFLLVLIISSYEISAFNGTGSAGEEIRFDLGYITANSTGGAAKIHGFGNKIAHIIKDDSNFKGWLSQLDYNFFAPEQVDLNFPLNNSYYNFTPDFDWSNTTDTEQFEVSYLFEIWNDSAAENINFVSYTITETANTTSTLPTINGEGIFYWRVAANDSSKNSSFTDLRAIIIDTTLPAAFNLTSPEEGASSTDTTPILQWDASEDTNLDNYTIEITTGQDFLEINKTEVSTTTSLTNWSSPLDTATKYYWRVSAVDKANNQRLSDNNRSFTVTASQTTTVIAITSETSAGGGTKPYTLNMLAPEGVTIYKEDTITIPLLAINPSAVAFRGISLRLSSTVPEISLALDKNYIPEISARGQEKLQLTVTTKNIIAGTYGLTIDASIVSPSFADTFRIFANLIEKDSAAAGEVSDRIEFAKQLFAGNPECLELSEYISGAESALQNNQRDKALSFAENAIEACNKLIERVKSFEPLTSQAVLFDKVKSQLQSKSFAIVAPQVFVLILIISVLLYFRRRKASRYKKREVKIKWFVILILASAIFSLYNFIQPAIIGYTIFTLTDSSSEEPFGNWSLGDFEETNLSDGNNNVTLNFTDGASTYAIQGNYTSQKFSPGNFTQWTNITWANTSIEGTNISFQIRSCKDSTCTEGIFVGPDNTSETYFSDSPAILNETLSENSTHFQFKAFLDTNGTSQAPILEEVNISYEDVNDPPVNLTISGPADNQFLNITNVTIEISNATDIDGDAVKYYLEVWNESDLTGVAYVNASISETASPTQDVTPDLEEGDYYLRVLSTDDNSNSSFSSAVNFTIDTTLPSAFNITSPENGTSTQDNTLVLEWDGATEANLENYTIELSLNETFDTINTTENSSASPFSSWTNPLAPATYYWRVSAVDKANNQRLSDNNLTFTIEAISEAVTVEGTKSVAGGSAPKPYSFKLIAPPSITILQDETITIPLKIQNIGNSINLNNILLSVQADSPGVIATLDKTFISTLKPDLTETVNLLLRATESSQDSFGVTVSAEVSTPRLQDSVKIITSVGGREDLGKQSSQQLVFAKKFFNGNPECSRLSAEIENAEQLIKRSAHEEAIRVLESAVNACRDLISVKTVKKPSLIEITFNAIKQNKTASIISSQVVVFIILLAVVLKKFMKKRKPGQIKMDF